MAGSEPGHDEEKERHMTKNALIVGVGSGLSASLARKLTGDGYKVGLASRNIDKLGALAKETDAATFACDATEPVQVAKLFADAERQIGPLDFVVFNAGFRVRGPFVELNPPDVLKTIVSTAYGAFLVGQEAAKRMLPRGAGAIFFTGASAGWKGYPQSAPFAMAKFALRGLAQSMARELQPKGIHIAHFNIDGGIRSAQRPVPADKPDSLLDPGAIAQTYIDVLKQHRSAWSTEVEVRPWVESF
jgi:NAD(P)-dependent dehydrogenase (short-subunit alcohol dehydrogenase family)